jgi:hypothetical protein
MNCCCGVADLLKASAPVGVMAMVDESPTTTVAGPVCCPRVAVMVTDPIPVPVTSPLSTVATAGFEVLQVAEFVMSLYETSVGELRYPPLAFNWMVSPGAIEGRELAFTKIATRGFEA